MTRRTMVPVAWLVSACVGCASIVGITEVPAGPGTGPDGGGGTTLHEGGGIILPDPDGSTGPGFPDTEGGTTGGDDEGGGGSSLPYAASNIGDMTFDPSITGPLTLNDGDSCLIYTEATGAPMISCSNPNPVAMDMFVAPASGGGAAIYVFTSITIGTGASLMAAGPNPLILIALGSVEIKGSVDVSADVFGNDQAPVPGAQTMSSGVGAFNTEQQQGGGGGSFCGTGGQGAWSASVAGPDAGAQSQGGVPYGTENLVPLVGGSAGGGANQQGAEDAANGFGGGAIQISAAGSIVVAAGGSINANGSGGVSMGDQAGEGAGSGGAILLEAPTVTIEGILEANGGEGSDPNMDGAVPPDDGSVATESGCAGGNGSAGSQLNGDNGSATSGGSGGESGFGGGGGGAGWIRINATNATLSGTFSPSLGTMCVSKGSLP